MLLLLAKRALSVLTARSGSGIDPLAENIDEGLMPWAESAQEHILKEEYCLVIEFPQFPHPVHKDSFTSINILNSLYS